MTFTLIKRIAATNSCRMKVDIIERKSRWYNRFCFYRVGSNWTYPRKTWNESAKWELHWAAWIHQRFQQTRRANCFFFNENNANVPSTTDVDFIESWRKGIKWKKGKKRLHWRDRRDGWNHNWLQQKTSCRILVRKIESEVKRKSTWLQEPESRMSSSGMWGRQSHRLSLLKNETNRERQLRSRKLCTENI